MKRWILLAGCVECFAVAIHSPHHQVRGALQALYNHVQALQRAADPIAAQSTDALHKAILRIDKVIARRVKDPKTGEIQRVHPVYGFMQRVYQQAVDQLGDMPLDKLPLFRLLSDQRVQKLLFTGSARGAKMPDRRKKAQQRFVVLLATAASGSVDFTQVQSGETFEELGSVQALLSYLRGEDDAWWRAPLDDFREKAEGAYVEQAADAIDRLMQEIDAKNPSMPSTFQMYTFPQLLSKLAASEGEEVRQALAEGDREAYKEFKEAVQEQIDEAQQQEKGASQPQLQSTLLQEVRAGANLRPIEQPQQEAQRPDSPQRLLEEIRTGMTPTQPTKKEPWWQAHIAQFAQEMEDDVSERELETLKQVTRSILNAVSYQPDAATQWFKDTIFLRFLSIMEDEEMLEAFVRDTEAQRLLRQAFELLWRVRSQADMNSTQLRQAGHFTSRGTFREGFAMQEDV